MVRLASPPGLRRVKRASGMRLLLLGAAFLLAGAGGPWALGAPPAKAHGTGRTPSVFPPHATTAASTSRCSRAQRRRALAREQRLVLAGLGPLTVLRNPADQAMLAARGWAIPPHGYTSLGGMGFTVTHLAFLAPMQPGRPHLLFYEPSREAKNVVDALGPDFPYRLRGWGYIPPYDYHQHPSLFSCLRRGDWFVHERGVHTLDGGFYAIPPEESVHGTAAGDEPALPPPDHLGVPHARFWDIHFWLGDRVPAVSLLNPGPMIPGVDPHLGEWFFYPPPAGRD